MQQRPSWRMGQETGREMTSSFGIPDSAPGPGTDSQGSPGMVGPGAGCEVVEGLLLSMLREKWREMQGLPAPPPPTPHRLTLHGAMDPESPIVAFIDDKPSPERALGRPRSPSTWSRLFPAFVSPESSFPRKLSAQERVKWTTEERHLPGAVRTGGHTAQRALVSYVRNELASLQLPHSPPSLPRPA